MDSHGVTEPRVERDQRGFTLIEVMIAILLCAITALGMIALFRANTRAGAFSRRETEAAVLAQDKLETLRTQLASTSSSTTTETSLDPNGIVMSDGAFTRTSEITVNGTLISIKVTVSWDDGSGTREVIVLGFRSTT